MLQLLHKPAIVCLQAPNQDTAAPAVAVALTNPQPASTRSCASAHCHLSSSECADSLIHRLNSLPSQLT